MTQRFPVQFAQPPLTQTITFAIAPFDAFTGERVGQGVVARIDGLPDQPVRNRSGLLVFVGLPVQASYAVRIDPAEAGYFAPPPLPVHAGEPADVAHAVPLMRLPARGYPDDTTLIRGVVHRSGSPVEGAVVAARADAAPPSTAFEVTSVAGGSFAVPLRLPRLAPGEMEGVRAVVVSVTDPGGNRLYSGDATAGRSHRFVGPLDLDAVPSPMLVLI